MELSGEAERSCLECLGAQESYDACLQSCRDSPELKDANQSGVFGVADAALGGEKANQDGKTSTKPKRFEDVFYFSCQSSFFFWFLIEESIQL